MIGVSDLLELMRKCKTVRKFKPDPIPEEYVERIVEAARWASSGANSQPWEFIIVKNSETKIKIADIFRDSIDTLKSTDLEFPFAPAETLWSRYANAPVIIVTCADPILKDAYPKVSRREYTYYASIGAAQQHMHLVAQALGLASCWGTVQSVVESKLKELLGVPPKFEVLDAMCIGYPDEQPVRYRRSLQEISHKERFDASKIRSADNIRNLIKNRKFADIYS